MTVALVIAAMLGLGAPADTVGPSRGPRDRAELEAFLDGVMSAQLAANHVAGATVAVVRDGAVLLVKGYGMADAATGRPVSGERTLFRIASITKTFTWTAVMQLVEQGRLDLDQDVNRYLDFRIPATYREPITLRHLLTHTAGFEEDVRDFGTDDPAALQPMAAWLEAHIPARVRPPGRYSSYSNFGAGLAGYIVQRVSGLPYEQYLEERIVRPLGMTRTTARQPLPQEFVADLSRGYRWSGGKFVAQPFQMATGAPPVGSMSTTAADMAIWMLAHLGGGAAGSARILADSTERMMQARAVGPDPRITGVGLGFYEQSSHGLRIVGHGGDITAFHSAMALIPDERLGVFVSYNTDTGGALSFRPFLTAFLDHYYPVSCPRGPIAAGAEERVARVVGQYQFMRRSYTTVQKATGLAGGLAVDRGDSATILIRSPFGTLRMAEVSPGLFRDPTSCEELFFEADSATGRVTHAFLGLAPMMALDRTPALENPRLHQIILLLGLVVFVGVLVAAVVRRLTRRPDAPGPRPGERRFLIGMAVVNLAFAAAIVILAGRRGLFDAGGAGTSRRLLRLAMLLPVASLALTVGAIGAVGRTWVDGRGSLAGRIRSTAAILVGLLFLWSLSVWNLLGWRI